MYQAIGLPASLHNETDVTSTKRMIWPFYFLRTYVDEKKIVVFSRMILRLKNPVLIPTNEVNITIPINISM